MLMQPKLAQPDASPHAHACHSSETKTPAKITIHVLEIRLCNSKCAPATPARASKTAPSELAQAGRQRVRTGIQQQHARAQQMGSK